MVTRSGVDLSFARHPEKVRRRCEAPLARHAFGIFRQRREFSFAFVALDLVRVLAVRGLSFHHVQDKHQSFGVLPRQSVGRLGGLRHAIDRTDELKDGICVGGEIERIYADGQGLLARLPDFDDLLCRQLESERVLVGVLERAISEQHLVHELEELAQSLEVREGDHRFLFCRRQPLQQLKRGSQQLRDARVFEEALHRQQILFPLEQLAFSSPKPLAGTHQQFHVEIPGGGDLPFFLDEF